MFLLSKHHPLLSAICLGWDDEMSDTETSLFLELNLNIYRTSGTFIEHLEIVSMQQLHPSCSHYIQRMSYQNPGNFINATVFERGNTVLNLQGFDKFVKITLQKIPWFGI